MISYDEFKKVEIRAGKIVSAEKIPDTDKLLKLTVDLGDIDDTGSTKLRNIVSGIALHFPDTAVLVGKTCMFVSNLEPRIIRGHESQGMIFAVSGSDGAFSLLEPNSSILPGALAA